METYGTDIPYELVRSKRRSIALQIKDGKLIVRAPLRLSKARIDAEVEAHREWIVRGLAAAKKRVEATEGIQPLTETELAKLKQRAKSVFEQRVAYYAPKIGVTYGNITVRAQKTRWGSCSSKGNLNFNCLLLLAPSEVLDSVVVHELCHRKEMNHSPRFYAEVLRVFPRYHEQHRWLKEHAHELFARLP